MKAYGGVEVQVFLTLAVNEKQMISFTPLSLYP
jgi:hypothetical protein